MGQKTKHKDRNVRQTLVTWKGGWQWFGEMGLARAMGTDYYLDEILKGD